MRNPDYLELWIALAATTVSMALLFGVGLSGWQGEEDSCLQGGQCFCEADRGGLVRQPANTASNLGFVASGLGIAFALGRQHRRTKRGKANKRNKREELPVADNPMTATRFYGAFYATVTALLGPASMALHASLTRWGSVFDILSMNLFITFVFFYAWMRWRGLTPMHFAVGYCVMNVALITVKISGYPGSPLFGLLAVLSLAIEFRLHLSGRVHADMRWILAAAGLFLAALGIWSLSHNYGLLCDPHSLVQGHAAWHLLCAGATLAIYRYMRSERGGSEAPGFTDSQVKP